eukprot:CAMPEP_0206464800 /NCGR_PEP_ID=MMETSP0324_2-20121206/27435_1 /ASSEMBLY_ACC=CAM_ASM_000836 /TAXON_ID=2866 /ORGANISM="Crypthecodinium cohnii, Strain Seligo" /LENGTH=243 /DNA_ID=CAMNT_0053937507 /DNA_START=199 /DNA_END=930 /DNA_ORIENTATION=+
MASGGILEGFKLNVSHQEIERILGEVEQWWESANEQAGIDFLPVAGIENFLMNDLGYEDMDEFEDALQGSFTDFLGAFPHIEVKEVEGKKLFKVNHRKPGPPRTLTVRVDNTKMLLDTTFLKAPDAELEIPSLEFSICAENKRHIDSLYNHLVACRDELETHCASLPSEDAERTEILKVVEALTGLLDVETPFDIVINDPSGLSEFQPSDKVVVENKCPTELVDRETETIKEEEGEDAANSKA